MWLQSRALVLAALVLVCVVPMSGAAAGTGSAETKLDKPEYDVGVAEVVAWTRAFNKDVSALLIALRTQRASKGDEDGAERIQRFQSHWVCYLGWNACVTGLAKDFIVNYLGRASYHDHNGRFLALLRQLSDLMGRVDVSEPAAWWEEKGAAAWHLLSKLYEQSETLFSKEGNLKNFFADLKSLVESKHEMGEAVAVGAPYIKGACGLATKQFGGDHTEL